MKFNEFERLSATVRDTVKATNYIFEQIYSPDELPEDLYYYVVKLHNSAIDYIAAIEELKNGIRKENKRNRMETGKRT